MSIEVIVSSSKPICLVGGAEITVSTLSEVADWVDCFVAVDSGADHLLRAGQVPKAVIGDLDSLSPDARATFADVLYHISEQSTTDFEKALLRVAAPVVIALGFTGGRLDHTLSVLDVMARYPDKAVMLLDDHDVSFSMPAGDWEMTLAADMRISVMPIGPATVTLSGVVWPFTDQQMQMAGFTSPSNAALGGPVRLITDAPVLITLPRSQLAVALTAVSRGQ